MGDEVAPVGAGQIVVVPAMVRHDITNTGDGILRVLGTFAGSTVVATFEEPVAPVGPQIFVIGGPMPIALPLATGAAPPSAANGGAEPRVPAPGGAG